MSDYDDDLRISRYAGLDKLGPDIRTLAGGVTTPVYMRRGLADQVVALIKQGRNVLLRGASGVGKTALVHGLPHADWPTKEKPGQMRLVESRPALAPLIVETTCDQFVQGCRWCHDLENKMAIQLKAARAKPAILFIENIDEGIGMGSSSSDPQTDVANLLCPHIDKGLQIIATVTPEGEDRLRAGNERLHGRFVVVEVPEPSGAEADEIAAIHLEALGKRGTTVSAEARSSGMLLAARYFPGTTALAGFVKLADHAAARFALVDKRTLKAAAAELLGLRSAFTGAGVPFSPGELRSALASEVLGQGEAIGEVVDALVRLQSGLVQPGRPVATFLLAGPTGVGKTSLALATARQLAGSEGGLLRFDMSEFSDPWAPRRLLDDGSTSLVGRLRDARAGVLLLDEIEKAHPLVIRLLLQALGEARLTSASGKPVRLDNFIVMLTTNVGARRWQRADSPEKAAALVLSDCAEEFPPEFLGRMTRTLLFRPLDRATAARIVARELDAVNELPGLAERGLQLIWPEELVDSLSAGGVSAEKGARGLQGLVRTTVVSPVARWLAENQQASDAIVSVLPRFEGAELVSLIVDWVDETGFYAGTRH